MSYCLYLRKSRADIEAETRGEGETLARHEKALLELAKRNNYSVTQIFREVVSGETLAARPQMQQLLSEVGNGKWDGVLVMDIDRLARGDTVDQGIVAQTFKFSDTMIITPTKIYHPNNEFDEEYFEFGLFMSRREYKTINRRLQRGRIASIKEGKYVGNKSPYGYKRVKIPGDKGFTLEPVPDEAEIINLIYTLYTTGEVQSDGELKRMGVSLIVRRLNDMKLPARNGGDWTPATVREIITNPVYIGKIRWNNRKSVKKMVDGQTVVTRPRAKKEEVVIADGLHPAIVDIDVWNAAQEIMSHNRARPIGEKNTVKNPLCGLIICGKCGRRMVRRPYSNRRARDSIICPYTSCDNVSADLCLVEERVLAALSDWLGEYRLKWEENPAQSSALSALAIQEKALEKTERRISELEKQRDNVYTYLERGIYTVDEFLSRSRKIAEDIEQANADRATLEEEIAHEKAREVGRKNIIPKVERVLDVYHELPTPQAKNDLLKEVIEKAVYIKEKNGRWHNPPDAFELTIYPKIPRFTEPSE